MTANLAPGVHVKEVERGAKPIEGVSTSVAGFLGPTERGPTDPQLVTSFADFRRLYGGYLEDSYLAPAVEGFFANGGSTAYVGRVTAADESADAALLAGSGDADPGTQPNTLWASTEVLDFGTAGASTTETITLHNLGTAGTDDAIEVVEGDLEVDDDTVWSVATAGGGDVTIDPEGLADLEVTYDGASDPPVRGTLTIPHDGDNPAVRVALHAGSGAIEITAVGPGAWGGHVAVFVDDAELYERGENQLFNLTIRYWADEDDLARAQAHDGDTEDERVPEPDVEESYTDLSPVESAGNYYVSVVNGASNLVDLEAVQPGRPATTDEPTWLSLPATFSDPGSPAFGDYQGDTEEKPENRTGLAGFATVDEISIVCVPDEHAEGDEWLAAEIKDHCVNMGDRFAVLQASRNPGRPGEVLPSENSDYAAFYYPWITVINAETGNEMLVPPGGHVAGIYARSDAEHGVHKAPANEVVRGARSLQQNINDGDQQILNPKGVNCIRSFRGRGILVWGARTTSPDPSWKYLNVRRLFLYLRESIQEGTQWVVFESNDQDLWARVEQTITNFLTAVWEDGALMGTTPEEAFFVKCDRTTMTQNDIDNGKLICEIGVAPVKPAEFVIFKISQWTGSAE